MKARFAAFTGLIMLLAWLPHRANESHRPHFTDSAWRDAPLLVPAALGGYRAVNRWHNYNTWDGTIEQGALYSDHSADGLVQLDMFLHSPGPHNGIACYLAQGFSFSSQGLRWLHSSDGEGHFQVAVLRADDIMQATASTECWSWGCQETPAGGSEGWSFVLSLTDPPPAETPVPVTITVDDSDLSGDSKERGDRLLNRLNTFIAQLDLARIERFAAEQRQY
jgi:hypothetical protein